MFKPPGNAVAAGHTSCTLGADSPRNMQSLLFCHEAQSKMLIAPESFWFHLENLSLHLTFVTRLDEDGAGGLPRQRGARAGSATPSGAADGPAPAPAGATQLPHADQQQEAFEVGRTAHDERGGEVPPEVLDSIRPLDREQLTRMLTNYLLSVRGAPSITFNAKTGFCWSSAFRHSTYMTIPAVLNRSRTRRHLHAYTLDI